MRVSVVLHLKPFLSQVNWLLRFFDCTAPGPAVILRAFTCLDKGPKTGGLMEVMGTGGLTEVMYKVL